MFTHSYKLRRDHNSMTSPTVPLRAGIVITAVFTAFIMGFIKLCIWSNKPLQVVFKIKWYINRINKVLKFKWWFIFTVQDIIVNNLWQLPSFTLAPLNEKYHVYRWLGNSNLMPSSITMEKIRKAIFKINFK